MARARHGPRPTALRLATLLLALLAISHIAASPARYTVGEAVNRRWRRGSESSLLSAAAPGEGAADEERQSQLVDLLPSAEKNILAQDYASGDTAPLTSAEEDTLALFGHKREKRKKNRKAKKQEEEPLFEMTSEEKRMMDEINSYVPESPSAVTPDVGPKSQEPQDLTEKKKSSEVSPDELPKNQQPLKEAKVEKKSHEKSTVNEPKNQQPLKEAKVEKKSHEKSTVNEPKNQQPLKEAEVEKKSHEKFTADQPKDQKPLKEAKVEKKSHEKFTADQPKDQKPLKEAKVEKKSHEKSTADEPKNQQSHKQVEVAKKSPEVSTGDEPKSQPPHKQVEAAKKSPELPTGDLSKSVNSNKKEQGSGANEPAANRVAESRDDSFHTPQASNGDTPPTHSSNPVEDSIPTQVKESDQDRISYTQVTGPEVEAVLKLTNTGPEAKEESSDTVQPEVPVEVPLDSYSFDRSAEDRSSSKTREAFVPIAAAEPEQSIKDPTSSHEDSRQAVKDTVQEPSVAVNADPIINAKTVNSDLGVNMPPIKETLLPLPEPAKSVAAQPPQSVAAQLVPAQTAQPSSPASASVPAPAAYTAQPAQRTVLYVPSAQPPQHSSVFTQPAYSFTSTGGRSALGSPSSPVAAAPFPAAAPAPAPAAAPRTQTQPQSPLVLSRWYNDMMQWSDAQNLLAKVKAGEPLPPQDYKGVRINYRVNGYSGPAVVNSPPPSSTSVITVSQPSSSTYSSGYSYSSSPAATLLQQQQQQQQSYPYQQAYAYQQGYPYQQVYTPLRTDPVYFSSGYHHQNLPQYQYQYQYQYPQQQVLYHQQYQPVQVQPAAGSPSTPVQSKTEPAVQINANPFVAKPAYTSTATTSAPFGYQQVPAASRPTVTFVPSSASGVAVNASTATFSIPSLTPSASPPPQPGVTFIPGSGSVLTPFQVQSQISVPTRITIPGFSISSSVPVPAPGQTGQTQSQGTGLSGLPYVSPPVTYAAYPKLPPGYSYGAPQPSLQPYTVKVFASQTQS